MVVCWMIPSFTAPSPKICWTIHGSAEDRKQAPAGMSTSAVSSLDLCRPAKAQLRIDGAFLRYSCRPNSGVPNRFYPWTVACGSGEHDGRGLVFIEQAVAHLERQVWSISSSDARVHSTVALAKLMP